MRTPSAPFRPSEEQKETIKDFFYYCKDKRVNRNDYLDLSRAAFDYIQETNTIIPQAVLAMYLLVKKRGDSINKIITKDFIFRSKGLTRP